MRHESTRHGLLAAILLLPLALVHAGDGREVIERARSRNGFATWSDRTSEVTMESFQDGGRLTREAIIRERTARAGDHQAFIDFTAPSDQRGTRMLHLSPRGAPDEYFWTPAARRARHIGGNAASWRQREEIFFGNDMSYRDLEMLTRILQWDARAATATVEDGPCGDATCYKVTLAPTGANEFPFSRYELWFTHDDLLLRRIELFDRGGSLLENITCEGYFAQGGIQTPRTYTIEHVPTKSRAVITIRSVTYNTGLEADVFSVANLERGS
jgi:hypothetical protein